MSPSAGTRGRPVRARTGRAAPLAPAERRAAIIDATIPLLRRHGPTVTTRQIAEAAGVAEGTIFSVFPDKDTLVAAAVDAALDPTPLVEELLDVDPDQAVEERLVAAVEVLQAHIARTWQLLVAVGPEQQARRPRPASSDTAARQVAALEPLFAAVGSELRQPPADAARALLALTVGCSHPAVVDRPMPPAQIVELLLDGIRGAAR